MIEAFMKSMRNDLHKTTYNNVEDYNKYIYGSADVVGLMCLKIFVNGDIEEFIKLKPYAMSLGSAFQKVNFLRDIKDDNQLLNRSYFPNIESNNLTDEAKKEIIDDIELDFKNAFIGLKQLPKEARFGVYTAYIYYKNLFSKLKKTHVNQIMTNRIRVSNPAKIGLLAKSFINFKLNTL
jgi:phytoene/squalene synthetase